MRTIPRYWGYVKTEDGWYLWRSSPTSQADAEEEARKAVRRISEYHQGNRPPAEEYPYGVTLREKLLEEINDRKGQLRGFITRNHAGAEVLNVRNVMFLDWDTPVVYPPLNGCLFGLFSWIGRLFGGKSEPEPPLKPIDTPHVRIGSIFMNPRIGRVCYEKPNPEWDARTPEAWEEQYPWTAVQELGKFMQQVTKTPEWGVRIYKTAAGYRGIVTHALFDPTDPETLKLMERFECDPQYIRLCKRQESFRARITPKGWRCGLWPDKLPQHFQFYYPLHYGFFYHVKKAAKYFLLPDHSHEEFLKRFTKAREIQQRFAKMKIEEMDYQEVLSLYQEQYEEAEETYEKAAAPFAACCYLGTVGSGYVHPEVRSILELHDEATKALCSEELNLA
ncbi:MAG: hypothetical protein FWE67_04435 [Planctomycetaceae bacterium]|nr:hypothetical protein [Planctomycetaceae bacterium]